MQTGITQSPSWIGHPDEAVEPQCQIKKVGEVGKDLEWGAVMLQVHGVMSVFMRSVLHVHGMADVAVELAPKSSSTGSTC